MKKRVLLFTLVPLLLVGCGGNTNNNQEENNNQNNNQNQNVTKYKVTFANTTLPSVEIEEGNTLSKPADPKKDDSVFVGWYMDASFTQEVVFPLTITSDTTIYANFYSHKEAFQKARNNTIGENVPGYEYDYTLNVTANYMSVNFVGSTTGNSKFNAASSDVTFYDVHTNSGQLFNDGSKYKFKKGNDLHEVSLDENGVVKKYQISQVGEEYKYDSSSFAKAVFEYDESKLKEIRPTQVAGEYQLKTGFNASQAISLVGNYLNHPIVEKLIGELPETSVNTGMYVTFLKDKLNSYRYEMKIDVSGIKFNLIYNLTFKNQGKAPTINPRTFNNTAVTEQDVSNAKLEIDNYLNSYKALAHSSYDFKVKTAVDFPNKNAINATIDGFTKRKVTATGVYYLNDYEVDTDFKNADLYKNTGLGDAHGGRVKLSNGEVHDLKKKLLGGYSDVGVVQHTYQDDYYLFDILGMINKVAFIEKIPNPSDNEITYAIGADNVGAVNVLYGFNDTLRLNPLGESSINVKAFGNFTTSSVTIKNFKFKIVVANNSLSEIELKMDGKISTLYEGSRDFSLLQDAGYKLTYELKVTNDGANYEPAESVSKVK